MDASSGGHAEDIAAARRQMRRLKWVTTILPAIVVFAYETVRHDVFEHSHPIPYGNLVVGLLVLFLAFVFTQFVFGIVERLQDQILVRQREVAGLAATVEERERLGRELHDGLAQVVAYLLIRIDTVSSLVAAGRGADAVSELEEMRATTEALYADIRDAIGGLRTRVVEEGLPAALRTYLADFEERADLEVDAEIEEGLGDLSPKVASQLFGIVREAMANVRKHARARTVRVSLCLAADGQVELTIVDDGRGFDAARVGRTASGGYGLTTMRERAESLGGTLTLESSPGGGTRVTALVPTGPRESRDEDVAQANTTLAR